MDEGRPPTKSEIRARGPGGPASRPDRIPAFCMCPASAGQDQNRPGKTGKTWRVATLDPGAAHRAVTHCRPIPLL